MSALKPVGDTRPTPPKRCRCGREGEWPGRLCPDCRTSAVVQPASTRTSAVVRSAPKLEDLAAIANAEHSRVHLAGRELLGHAIRAGEALMEARGLVQQGEWLAWAAENVQMHMTTAYRYMRMAEYREQVLASDVTSIEAAIQLLADHPRRGYGPRGYSDADKAEWIRLADEIGVKPAARAVGVSPATMHRWTSPTSPSRGQTRQAREVTEERIEALAKWLVKRFGGYDYPERVTAQVRVDAATALKAVFVPPEKP